MGNGPQFFQTLRGRKFFELDIPKLASSLEELAAETKRANDLKEKELELKERSLDIKVESEMVVFTRIWMAIESLAETQDEIIDHQKIQAKALNELPRLKREKGI